MIRSGACNPPMHGSESMHTKSRFTNQRHCHRGLTDCPRSPRSALLRGLAVLCAAWWCIGSHHAVAATGVVSTKPAFAPGHILVGKNPNSANTDFLTALRSQHADSLGKLRGLEIHVVNVRPGDEQ